MLTAVFTAVLSGAVRAPDVASTNITPDPSGISYYDLAMFMQAMRTGFGGARKLSQIMPWHLPRDDRRRYRGIFAYIKTFKPVRHHTPGRQLIASSAVKPTAAETRTKSFHRRQTENCGIS
jgi:hypothetical protein